MWPDEPYAPPRGSFGRPVLPPTSEPGAAPLVNVSINCQWLPYIRGALQQLLLQSTWNTDKAGLALVQGRVFNLIDLFQECGSAELPFACSGDTRSSASPFGVWTVNPSEPGGAWTPSIGWQATEYTVGTQHIVSVDVIITFSRPFKLTKFRYTYDLNLGSFDNANDYQTGLQDLTNGGFLGVPILFGGATPGSGLQYEANGNAAPTQQIRIFMRTAYNHFMSPPVPGLGFVIGADMTGVSANPPC